MGTIYIECESVIRIVRIHRNFVDVEIVMPNGTVQRKIKQGDTYHNTIKLEMEVPEDRMIKWGYKA